MLEKISIANRGLVRDIAKVMESHDASTAASQPLT